MKWDSRKYLNIASMKGIPLMEAYFFPLNNFPDSSTGKIVSPNERRKKMPYIVVNSIFPSDKTG